MVNKIIDGISNKIYELFGEKYSIYSESIEQGFKEPCFFICLLKPTSKSKLKNRSYREYNFDIHYFPSKSNSKNEEMLNVGETLIEELEYITVDGGLIRGSKISYEIIDDVLHFNIKYSLFTIREDAIDEKMGALSINQTVKR